MISPLPDGYATDLPVPPGIAELLADLTEAGFILSVTGPSSKTIRIAKHGRKRGYVNDTILEGGGVLGYAFGAWAENRDSAPDDVSDDLLDRFCVRYGCSPSVVHPYQSGGTNAGRRFLLIKSPEVALAVLIRDARTDVRDG